MALLTAPMHTGRDTVRSVASSWGDPDRPVTITLAGLAAAAARQSTALDLAVLQSTAARPIQDIFFLLKAKKVSGATAGAAVLSLSLAGNTGGATWPGTITGTDSAYSGAGVGANIRPAGAILGWGAGTETGISQLYSAAGFFGSNGLPSRLVFVVSNLIGQALTGTAGDHALLYQVVYAPA